MARKVQPRCMFCGRFVSKADIEAFGNCFDCEDRLEYEEELDFDEYDDDDEDLDFDEDEFDDVGRTLLEAGCALTEDERRAFGISDAEYFDRM